MKGIFLPALQGILEDLIDDVRFGFSPADVLAFPYKIIDAFAGDGPFVKGYVFFVVGEFNLNGDVHFIFADGYLPDAGVAVGARRVGIGSHPAADGRVPAGGNNAHKIGGKHPFRQRIGQLFGDIGLQRSIGEKRDVDGFQVRRKRGTAEGVNSARTERAQYYRSEVTLHFMPPEKRRSSAYGVFRNETPPYGRRA